jgi:two-component system chemotaxis response regulator CheY
MGYNVLVVDDSKIVREFMIKTLRLTGFTIDNIYLAENGQAGMDIIRLKSADIIFLDINMPVMTGIEMVRKMDEEGYLKKIPVVIVSTEGSETRIDELKAMGIRDYVRKPFTPESIRDIMRKVLPGGVIK